MTIVIISDKKVAVTVEGDRVLGDDDPRVFGSRLAAHQYFQAHPELLSDSNGEDDDLESSGWRLIRYRDLVVKPRPIEEPVTGLLIDNPIAAAEVLLEAHDRHCRAAERWMRAACPGADLPEHPKPKATILTPDWAGLYSSADHSCCYPLTYVMINGAQSADDTAAHEVAHAYQRAFTGCGKLGHGPDFYALMRHALGKPISEHTHSYDIALARRLSRQTKKWWDRELERGALARLPMEIAIVRVKRKGIQ